MAELPQLFMRLPSLMLAYPVDNPSEQAMPDDAPGIAALLTEAFEEPWDVERVHRELGPAGGVDATYVVRDDGRVVAVASARHLSEQYPEAGYLHYVGAYRTEAGRGLGGLVTWAVLRHFRDEGLTSVVLETDDFRLPAIRTYLKIGFVPEYRHAQDQSRWSKIFPLVLGRRQNPAARSDG